MAGAYILRISSDEYEENVFKNRCYYVGVRRKWEEGTEIFLARKRKDYNDSFIGYAVIKKVYERNELSVDERKKFNELRWDKKLEFSKLIAFDPPKPIKDVLPEFKGLKGRVLHGRKLEPEQVRKILTS